MTRNPQLGERTGRSDKRGTRLAATETEETGFFTKQKSESVVETTVELFCEGKKPGLGTPLQSHPSGGGPSRPPPYAESRDPTGDFGLTRAVFFDAGNTLLRPWPSVGHIYARTARRHGVQASPEWVNQRFQAEWKRRNGLASLKNDRLERAWWRALVRRLWGARFTGPTFQRYYEELYSLFGHPRVWRLYKDALPTLRALKAAGYRLGIVSNWDSRLFGLCDQMGLSQSVSFVLASAVEGTVKPDRKIFHRALGRAQVSAGEALHVGDSYREDYWGAKRAGLSALLLDRKGQAPSSVDTLRSLHQLVRRLIPPQSHKKRP